MTQTGVIAVRPVGCSAKLWRVLVSLATRPEHEPGKSSANSVYAENLVVEFDDAYTNFVEQFDRLPSESQLLALQAVDTKLAAMVGSKDAALWTVRACRDDSSWDEVRALAERAIGELNWPLTLV